MNKHGHVANINSCSKIGKVDARNLPRMDYLSVLLKEPEILSEVLSLKHRTTTNEVAEAICCDVRFADQGRIEFPRLGRFSVWLIELGSANACYKPGRDNYQDWTPPSRFISATGSEFPAILDWNGAWSGLMLTFNHTALARVLPANMRLTDLDQNWDCILDDTHRDLIQTMQTIRETLSICSPSIAKFRDSLAYAFVGEFFSRCNEISRQPEAPASGLRIADLRMIYAFIEENLHRRLMLSEIAAVVGMTSWHLGRSFKQSTGISPYQYILERRIEKAKERLRHPGSITLAELALEIGFCDQSQFSVMFKKHTGMTPKEFARH